MSNLAVYPDDDFPCKLFVTLYRYPTEDEDLIVYIDDIEQPRSSYNLLRNLDTGNLIVYKEKSTIFETITIRVEFRFSPDKKKKILNRIRGFFK